MKNLNTAGKTARVTIDRTSWRQSICDLRVKANTKGLTRDEAVIAQAIYNVIPQYRAAARVLAKGQVYTRCAPQVSGYGDLDANCGSAYIWENGSLVTITHNTPYYRLHRMIDAWQDYKKGLINPEVWNNYSHGGYLTRRGLYANYSKDTGARHVVRYE